VASTRDAATGQRSGDDRHRAGGIDVTNRTQFTAKQVKALQMVNLGLSNQEIAEKLSITVGTTKWHLHQIFNKLKVHNRPAAAAEARRRGII